jgi:aspartate oxidase
MPALASVDYQIAIIGSGAAGLMAAIHASTQPGVALITDGPVGQSNSIMAQGGLQLPLPTAESRASFLDDILRSAREPLDTTLVHNFVTNVERTVEELADWGLELDRDASGAFVRQLAGGLSEPRIVSARDQIGPSIVRVLRDRLKQCRIEIRDRTQVVDLQPHDGAFTLSVTDRGGERASITARTVVCCSGGITYRRAQQTASATTNPANANHVLFDRLVALGLPLIHPDYFQYQPFGLVVTHNDDPGRAVPESITNTGVRLLDRNGADIGSIRQDRLSLTQLMFQLADEGRAQRLDDGQPGFWLTLSEADPQVIATRFPKLHLFLERHRLFGQNVLVYPFLHYYLGGLKMNARCETSIPGLFIAGEMAGGIHGRNRLMGNGITDSLVHGGVAGRAAAASVAG